MAKKEIAQDIMYFVAWGISYSQSHLVSSNARKCHQDAMIWRIGLLGVDPPVLQKKWDVAFSLISSRRALQLQARGREFPYTFLGHSDQSINEIENKRKFFVSIPR
jgi:hypothetical protein